MILPKHSIYLTLTLCLLGAVTLSQSQIMEITSYPASGFSQSAALALSQISAGTEKFSLDLFSVRSGHNTNLNTK